jgi:hypothetical protein
MTKKAQNIYKQYEERIDAHVSYTKRFSNNFEWDYEYTREIYEDFRNMISGMYLFNLMKESDYKELYDKAFEKYMEMDKELLKIGQSA